MTLKKGFAFAQLGLSDETLRAIEDVGYETPTEIQSKAIPEILKGRDLMGCAQTGTGKTAAFTLPIIEHLKSTKSRARMPRCIVLVPTRELANQVSESFTAYGQYTKLKSVVLIGGEPISRQEKKLSGGLIDLIIATPGRLLDFVSAGKLLLTDCKILVIDEADRMMDMGFIPDVEKIVGALPKKRQTLFFSATMAPPIKKLTKKFLTDPAEVFVTPQASTANTIDQKLVRINTKSKKDDLIRLINHEKITQAIIFCNRKRDIQSVVRALKTISSNVGEIHGDLHQSKRNKTLDAFKTGAVHFLVASDVAARGIDVSDLSCVINYDLPPNPEDYVHRIGRTGRAGQEGKAYSLVTADDGKAIKLLFKTIGRDVPYLQIDESEETALHPRPADIKNHVKKTQDKPRDADKKPQGKPRSDDKKLTDLNENKIINNKNNKKKENNKIEKSESVLGFGSSLPAFFNLGRSPIAQEASDKKVRKKG